MRPRAAFDKGRGVLWVVGGGGVRCAVGGDQIWNPVGCGIETA
jgi:hypothetical protein